MSSGNDITTEAVRLSLAMNQLRAENASQNIARAGTPGAQATRLDFARSQNLLSAAAIAGGDNEAGLLDALARAAGEPTASTQVDVAGTAINLDEEVADMSASSLEYQALTESLSRHFGLMRLAITGRN